MTLHAVRRCGVDGRHVMDELDRQYLAVDDLENHLGNEYESGRLFRLSLKLAQVNERPEVCVTPPHTHPHTRRPWHQLTLHVVPPQHNLDPGWAETGNRYILKLFRDYVYHQVRGYIVGETGRAEAQPRA